MRKRLHCVGDLRHTRETRTNVSETVGVGRGAQARRG
jgi:hypothetical protein